MSIYLHTLYYECESNFISLLPVHAKISELIWMTFGMEIAGDLRKDKGFYPGNHPPEGKETCKGNQLLTQTESRESLVT